MTSDVDPTGKNQHEPGSKLDGNKVDMSLLLDFSRALKAVALIGTLGSRKYTRGGWQTVPEGRIRYTAAMLRHLTSEQLEEYDQDLYDYFGVQLPHEYQVAWNALARLELKLREDEQNESNQT